MTRAFHIILKAYFALYLAAIAGNASAQSISITPAKLTTELKTELLGESRFYLSGPQAFGLDTIETKLYKMGGAGKYLLTLTALKLVEQGTLALDVPLYSYIPDIVEEIPFTRPITLRHLLTETAGFAVPDIVNEDLPLIRYTTAVRTAGHVYHHDPVGWAVLKTLLERVSGTPLEALVTETISLPLGLPPHSFKLTEAHKQFPLDSLVAEPELLAAIIRITVWNITPKGERFLPASLYRELVESVSWGFHPAGPARTLGLALSHVQEQVALEPFESGAGGGPYFMAFPHAGMAFVSLSGKTPDFITAIETVAQTYFVPDSKYMPAKNTLVEYEPLHGLYVQSDAPSLSMKTRLKALETEARFIHEYENGILIVSDRKKPAESYQKVGPFHFENYMHGKVTFSPYKQGGYMMLNGTLYRYVGILGDKKYVIDFLPVLLLLLCSSVLYLRHKDKSWRNMAFVTLLGTSLFTLGAAAEYVYWDKATYIWDMGWLISLWRFALNAGLALILSHPLFTLSFARNNKMPTSGFAIFLVPLHMGLVSIAAAALFLTAVAWGIVGSL